MEYNSKRLWENGEGLPNQYETKDEGVSKEVLNKIIQRKIKYERYNKLHNQLNEPYLIKHRTIFEGV